MMRKGKLIIHPPGTPLPPGHPFATPKFFFGGRRRTHITTHSGSSSQSASLPQDGTNAEDAYIIFRSKLQQALEEGLRAEGYVEMPKQVREANESGDNRLYVNASETVLQPLVPPRAPDLEDIAFEILRLRYKGR